MDHKVTMKDIAKDLNLSINAISLALNNRVGVSEITRMQVLKKAEELGYLDQRTKYVPVYSSKNICVLLNNIYFRDMHFYGKVLLGIEEEARISGYDVLINSYEGDQKIPNCIEHHKVSGIIAVGKIEDDYLMKLKNYNIPIILTDHTSLVESTDSILTDNKLGAFKATKYLIDKDFKAIGFFGDLDYTLSVKERYWGYTEALRLLLPGDSFHKIVEYSEEYSILNNLEQYILKNDTDKIVKRLGDIRKMPQAFVCSNDSAAIQLGNALRLLGYSIPDQISIIGFDNIELCTMILPKLTTIKVNKRLMGKKAMDTLIWRLSHKKDPVEKVMMDVEIVERDSVCKSFIL